MTVNEIEKEVLNTVILSTETELEISKNTCLIQDMGLSSIEVMILISDLEERFKIRIAASRLRNVQTIGDLCTIVTECLL